VFGLSFQKLLVLVIAVVGIIAVFRLVNTLKRQQELARREQEARPRQRQPEPPPRRDQAQIEDMAACGRCGAYIAAEAGGCGRRDCPYKSK